MEKLGTTEPSFTFYQCYRGHFECGLEESIQSALNTKTELMSPDTLDKNEKNGMDPKAIAAIKKIGIAFNQDAKLCDSILQAKKDHLAAIEESNKKENRM